VNFSILHLREQARHLPSVAEWIFREWWSNSGSSVQNIENWLKTHLSDGDFPTTLIAIARGEPIGSVSLHDTEAEDRPAFTPYLGALYVSPEWRGSGVGNALVRAVEEHARHCGFRAVYLNAANRMLVFYERLGWHVVEREYSHLKLNIMRRTLDQETR